MVFKSTPLSEGVEEIFYKDTSLGTLQKKTLKSREFFITQDGIKFDRKYLASRYLYDRNSGKFFLTTTVKKQRITAPNSNPTIIRTSIIPPESYRTISGTFIGIDPGSANMGITVMRSFPFSATCYEVHFDTTKDHIEKIQKVFEVTKQLICDSPELFIDPIDIVIEGASFGNAFGQVELSEARTASILAVQELFEVIPHNIKIVAPKAIRATVFGSALLRAEELWKDLPPDAASSLCCALCATKIFH